MTDDQALDFYFEYMMKYITLDKPAKVIDEHALDNPSNVETEQRTNHYKLVRKWYPAS